MKDVTLLKLIVSLTMRYPELMIERMVRMSQIKAIKPPLVFNSTTCIQYCHPCKVVFLQKRMNAESLRLFLYCLWRGGIVIK